MDHNLPINVTSEGLFEKGDKSSNFLMTKLSAWLNFETMKVDWYGDEDLVLKVDFTLMPEQVFLDNQVDNSQMWQTFSDVDTTALFHHDESNTTINTFVMLSNDELNHVMAKPNQVEPLVQNKLKKLINHFATLYNLESI
ncbi:MAG: hypothetical protein HWE10_05420 [Gammaproteobacteria bacterium]|nr:hypothetical protein [Gammaproteobacteria bacterium]